MTKIATDIPYEIFYDIKEFLENNGWNLSEQYPDIFDKGIDVDYYTFNKDGKILQMHWDIYFHGEIKAPDEVFNLLGREVDYSFVFGVPVNLK